MNDAQAKLLDRIIADTIDSIRRTAPTAEAAETRIEAYQQHMATVRKGQES